MSLEVFKKPSSIGIFTPMFLFYTCLPPFVFCYKNGLVIPMFSAPDVFVFVAGYPAGADLWPHGVCAEAGRFCLPQAGGHNTLHHTLPYSDHFSCPVRTAGCNLFYFIAASPIVSIARSAYSMPKIFDFYFNF